MKKIRKIALGLAGGLALNASLFVCRGAAPGNPYEPIVTRNVFDLNPPQRIAIKPPEPPSKITPDGIMTIFGTRQVLFKVAIPPHPPKPATEKSYILSEGQGQDGIEVKHIDDKNNVITFDNHGVMQQIPLVKAGPITTPTPVVMRSRNAPPPGAPNFRQYARHLPPNLINRLNQVRNSGNNNSSGNSGNNYGNFGGVNNGYGSGAAQSQKKLSPEEQMIMIAAQHAHAQQEGSPIAKLFPPTPLDKAAGVVPNPAQGSQPGSQ